MTYHHEPGADDKPQAVIPGAERITQRQLAGRRMQQPKRATCPQKEPSGLFSDARDQEEMF